MDRVLVDPGMVTLIDFKTGSRNSKEHREQIAAYKGILKDIYPGRDCQGILVYVDLCNVETV
jgi:ATP-dependent exoDNAse (exonuclease V) beta subunit